MGFHIEDGTGKGYSLRVDGANRSNIAGKTRSYGDFSTTLGDSFNINSGLITLTTTDEQGVLYFKNNETRDFHVTAIVAILGPSTGGVTTDTTHVRVYKNPTTGTLISEANDADVVSNRNFGSSLTLTADAYKGDASATVTDGTVHIESLVNPGSRVSFNIDEVLTKGDSIAITYEANDSNTSMKVMGAITGYLEDSDD